MKVAIVHDFLNQRGGAERTALAIARLFPEAPVYTSLYEPEDTFEEFAGIDVRTSFMQKLPHGERIFRALLPLYPPAFRSFDLSKYDLVISSSTHWSHHVRVPNGFHVVYCHNPPRWLYQSEDYVAQEGGLVPVWARLPLIPVLRVLRSADQKAAKQPDAYICNSRLVAARIWQTYGRKAIVVNPPVDLSRFAEIKRPKEGGDYYLVVSRLLPYKRVDLAVEVCSRRGVPLVVVGDGPARADLEAIAGPNVRFVGSVGDAELLDLFAGARALIHSGEEDFGLMPLEANAAGIPSVCIRNAGALETVVPGVTGILFPEQRGGMLNAALDELERTPWDASILRAHAEKFSEKVFQLKLLNAIGSSVASRARGVA